MAAETGRLTPVEVQPVAYRQSLEAARDLSREPAAAARAREGQAIDESEVRAQLKAVPAKFKIPKRVLVKPELPHNSMRKFQSIYLLQ